MLNSKLVLQQVPSSIKSLGVIGSGQMGVGIALVAANVSKLPVTLVDNSAEALKRGKKFMGMLWSL
jgi:3-hydroxybutyryl-CoA dehydrogenase